MNANSIKKSLIALAAVALGSIQVAPAMAQSASTNFRNLPIALPTGRNIQIVVPRQPVPANGLAVALTANLGAIGNRVDVAIRPNLSAPALVIFNGGNFAPANINVRVQQDARGYYITVPPALCYSNVKSWVVKIQLANGMLFDPAGLFARPVDCR